MDMDVIRKLRKTLSKQLEDYSEMQNLGGNALEDVCNIVRTIKNLDIIGGQDVSQRGQFMGSYDESYRRGRDSMGRFVSRDDGMSMRSYHDDMREMTEELRKMMNKTDDPSVQNALRQAMNQIGGM